jgi:16S rRNA (cytosine1402-N4)-methyltransferase
MSERERHVPVLFEQVMEMLQVRRGGTYVDATLGFAGHASGVLRQLGPDGRLIAFDRDPAAIELAKARMEGLRSELGSEMPEVVIHDREFSGMSGLLEAGSVDGLLADFGASSMHFDEAHRGFSFQADGPLDMRMNPREGVTAEQVVNEADENDLANLIYEFGEERRSRRIARALVRARPITTTAQLARVVSAAAPPMNRSKGKYKSLIHPATQTFQALRIYVNAELSEIDALLSAAPRVLKPGGRLVVISFHSLEDRRAKDALREGLQQGIYEVLTKKPLVAELDEIERNPRSRSAKLRAAERTKLRLAK